MKFYLLSLLLVILPFTVSAKEIALTFDDAPGDTTAHFTPEQRTDELIRKLKLLKVPPVIIFANPCNGGERGYIHDQLKKFRESGHVIGNHTCTHPRLDDVGFDKFVQDTLDADKILSDLMVGPVPTQTPP